MAWVFYKDIAFALLFARLFASGTILDAVVTIFLWIDSTILLSIFIDEIQKNFRFRTKSDEA